MNDKPVSIEKIRKLIDEKVPLRTLFESIKRLQEEYEQGHHGLRLQEVAGGYQFRTKASYSKYVQDLFRLKSLTLSASALEVLAIVAYKQPISRSEVDKIRGVDNAHILRALIEKRLIKASGRSDELGRPTIYNTTSEFLEVFSLSTIEDLPPEHELEDMANEGVGKVADIKSLVDERQSDKFMYDEASELDDLSEKINEIRVSTKFTKELVEQQKNRKIKTDVAEKSAFDLLGEYADTTGEDENSSEVDL